jgi:hypothetical protein
MHERVAEQGGSEKGDVCHVHENDPQDANVQVDMSAYSR